MIKTYYRHRRDKITIRSVSRILFKNIVRRKILLFSLISLLIILPISLIIFNNKSAVEAAWWNDTWAYRKVVSISNNTVFAGTNIPYKIIIDTQTLISAGKMQADADDIRVLDKNGKVLRHQVEQSTLNTTTTGLWFEGSVSANSYAQYYIYYGNPSASAKSFTSNVLSAGGGSTVEMTDGFGYSTSTSHARISDIRLNGANIGVNGNYHYTGSYPGSWWDDRAFSRTLLASGPLFVEVKYEDTNYGSYSSFGTNIKMFANGFAETRVYMNYNTSGSEQLYYYLHFDNGTRNSLWVNGSEVLVDQAPNSGTLYQANLGDNWFGQRWTGTGNYGGTIITKNGSDWYNGYTSAQASYYQTNYSYTQAFSNGSSRQIRYGVFAGTGTSNQMSEKASLLGGYSTSIQTEEQSPAPIAYWKFDEGTGTTTNNSTSITGLNGTLGTNASWKTEDQCMSGKCIYIDDSGTSTWETVKVTDNAALTDMSALTVGVWIKTVSNKSTQQIIYKRNSTGTPSWWSYKIELNSLKPTFYVINSSGTSVSAQADTAIELNKWYYLTGVYDGSQVQIYVNSKAADSTPANLTGTVINSDYRLQIGGLDTASSYYVKGYLDDVKIYSYARTAAQIKADFASKGSGSVKGTSVQLGTSAKNNDTLSNGLTTYLKSDETSSNGLDSSGNANTTTVSGASNYGGGKFGNGFRSGIATTNLSTNPSLETNGTNWQYWLNSGTGTAVRSTDTAEFGSYSYKSTMTVNGSMGHYAGTTAVSPSTQYSVSGWVKITSWGGSNFAFYMREIYPTGNGQCGANLYTASGVTNGWVRFSGTCTTRSDTTNLTVSFYLGNVGQTVYVDGIQIEQSASATPYTDGSLGTGYAWTGTAHGSTSTRATSTATTATNVNDTTGTIAFWFNSPSLDTSAQCPLGSSNGDSTGGMFFSLKNTGVYLTHNFATSQQVTPQYVATINNNTWYHVAYNWDNTLLKGNLYVNGALQQNISYSQAITIGEYLQNLGTCTRTGYTPFNGTLDDLRTYNRALSPKEVRNLYAWAPGPVGYWNLDEKTGTSANDISGNGFNSTSFIGSPTWKLGKFGSSLDFTGTNKYITLPAMTGKYSGMLTVSAWVYHTTSANWDDIVAGGCGDILFGFSNNQLNFGGQCNSPFGMLAYTTNINGAWHYVTGTYDGSMARLYVDGIQVNSIARSGSFTPGAITISRTAEDFQGQIDDVKIYNYARTSGQIVEDMNAGHPLGGSPVGSQVGYWKFDEGYGDTTNNSGSSGSTINGNLAGSGGSCPGAAACPTWNQNGKFGKALTFDGSNDYVDISSSNFDFSGNDFTISLWANYYGYISHGSAWNCLIGRDDAFSTTGYGVCTNSNNQVQFSAGNVQVNSGVNITNGWHHIVTVHDSKTPQLRIYVDGVLKNSAAYANQLTSKVTALAAIGEDSQGSRQANSIIDEVKIYNAALTADEIKLDYNRGSAMVLGTLSDTSGLSGGSIASSSAGASYCIPGGTTTCNPPVGEWKMDEKTGTVTTYDTSGNGINATLQSSPSWTQGKFGSGLSFNGTSQYLTTPSNSLTNFSAAGQYTIESWVKLDQYQPNGGTGGCCGSRIAYNNSGNGGFDWRIWNSGTVNFYRPTTWCSASSSQTVPLNQWVHLAATYNNQQVYIYMNGKQIASTSSCNFLDSTAGVTINYPGGNHGLYGDMDNVQIYNYARTPAQIAYDYNRGTPVGHWKLDECQGGVANDSSGNGNTGTITIGATGTNTSAGTCTGSAGEAWKDGATGKYNSSLEFDGTDDTVLIPYSSSLNPTNSISITAWVKPNIVTAYKEVLRQEETNRKLLSFQPEGATGTALSFGINVGGSYTELDAPITASEWTNGSWHFITATFNGSVKKIYDNGKEIGSENISGALGAGTQPIYIGSSNGGGEWMNGQIDDVRIYNYALTPVQIKHVYNNGAINFGPATGSP